MNKAEGCCEREIPYSLESIQKNECYEVKIKNVYDLSKFWMVVKFNELLIFMAYLHDFYENQNKLPIPYAKLKKGLSCIVYKNDLYYRAVILPVALHVSNKIRTFLVDYGLAVNIEVSNVFYMFEKHRSVPRFAIRSALAYVAPAGYSKSWTLGDLHEFCKMIEEKQVYVKILEIETLSKVVFVDIQTFKNNLCNSISFLLVRCGIAKYISDNDSENEELTRYKKNIEQIHLYPSFYAIENGIVPSSLWEHTLLQDCVPKDILYKEYYEYKEINSSVFAKQEKKTD